MVILASNALLGYHKTRTIVQFTRIAIKKVLLIITFIKRKKQNFLLTALILLFLTQILRWWETNYVSLGAKLLP